MIFVVYLNIKFSMSTMLVTNFWPHTVNAAKTCKSLQKTLANLQTCMPSCNTLQHNGWGRALC